MKSQKDKKNDLTCFKYVRFYYRFYGRISFVFHIFFQTDSIIHAVEHISQNQQNEQRDIVSLHSKKELELDKTKSHWGNKTKS